MAAVTNVFDTDDKSEIALRIRKLTQKALQLNNCKLFAESEKEFEDTYTLGTQLGEGGFAVVYNGTRKQDGLEVALKFIPKSNILNWERYGNEVIPMEAAVLRDMTHPNIIHLYATFDLGKVYVLVLEKIQNAVSLFDLIKEKGKLKENRVRNIFKQLVDICLYLQKGNIWYRDLKLENILFDTENDIIKLIDFGGAVKTGRVYFSREFEGTLEYCSPEHFTKETCNPSESTSWSLGVLLYYISFGKLPFNTTSEIIAKEPKFDKATITEDHKDLLQRLITKKSTRRIILSDISQHKWMKNT